MTVTVRSVANMRVSWRRPSQPSQSEIAAPIRATADDRADLRADEHGDRQLRAPVGPGRARASADDRGQADRERELAEVEEQLDRRQPAVEQQRQRGADDRGDHEVAAGGEDEAEDERDVAEREGVRVAAELEVDDAALADEEPEREPPPGARAARAAAAGRSTGPTKRAIAAAQMARFSHQTGCTRRSAARMPRWGVSTPSAIELESVPMGRPKPSIGSARLRLSRAQETGARARMFRRT